MSKTVRVRGSQNLAPKADLGIQALSQTTIANGGVNIKVTGEGSSLYLGVDQNTYYLRSLDIQGLSVQETPETLDIKATFAGLLDTPEFKEGGSLVVKNGKLEFSEHEVKPLLAGEGIMITDTLDGWFIECDLPEGPMGPPGMQGPRGLLPKLDYQTFNGESYLTVTDWVDAQAAEYGEIISGNLTGESAADCARRLGCIPPYASDMDFMTWLRDGQNVRIEEAIESSKKHLAVLEATLHASSDQIAKAEATISSLHCFPEDFGALSDGQTDCSQAIRDASILEREIVFRSGVYLIAQSSVVHANIRVERGAMLLIPDGVSLTLAGEISAGNYQIFTGWAADQSVPHQATAHDRVKIQIVSPQTVKPEWWGARGTARINDRPAFQRALLALPSRGRLGLRQDMVYSFAEGGLTVGQQGGLSIDDKTTKFTLEGNGVHLIYDHNMIWSIKGVADIHIKDLRFDGGDFVIQDFKNLKLENLESHIAPRFELRANKASVKLYGLVDCQDVVFDLEGDIEINR